MHFLESDRSSLLQMRISEILTGAEDDSLLVAAIDALAQQDGPRVYKEFLRVLVGKHFDTKTARNIWYAAQAHREKIFRPGFPARRLRTAIFDYLHCEIGELTDPRILESDYLHNINRTSVTDGLTGLFHQTYFKQNLGRILSNRRRGHDLNFAILLFDLDHFKQYNDRCGHLAGDEALRRTAEIIRSCLREGDVAARYGGEEFAVLLPNSNRSTAFAVADRIRAAIEAEAFACQGLLELGNLTISGGVAVCPEDADTVDGLIAVADAELYKAKARRNTIHPHRGDRRLSIRRPVRSLVEYASAEGALFRPALSLDISEGGIALGCEHKLEPGTRLALRLTRPFWEDNLQTTGIIRQVRKKGSLVFVGLEFEPAIKLLGRILPPLACAAG